ERGEVVGRSRKQRLQLRSPPGRACRRCRIDLLWRQQQGAGDRAERPERQKCEGTPGTGEVPGRARHRRRSQLPDADDEAQATRIMGLPVHVLPIMVWAPSQPMDSDKPKNICRTTSAQVQETTG